MYRNPPFNVFTYLRPLLLLLPVAFSVMALPFFLHSNTSEVSSLAVSMEDSLMNIYWFIGSRSNIYIFNMARHAPLPLMYVAGHSSSGQNRLEHSLAPPASQPPSRSVCVFISTCLNYAKAQWQKTLTLARNKLVPCWRCKRILYFSLANQLL